MRRYERDDINLVFNTIILSDKDPISNKKLSLKTGLNRDRIRIICNQLEHDQNKITIIENGKRRSYTVSSAII
jgi:predicted transcriptional regulator